ncbi:MAG: type 4a pilus biogenesis protein PilO [Candidatus Blackburnbacteria bacterium]|nr:type 4a pilus biogenesis protein PilO [Candidatus Blackburnbacteria bacterium]
MANYREQYAKYNRYFTDLARIYGKRPEVRASIEILLTLLTISFFAIFAIRPTASTISQLFSDIQSQKEIEKKLDEKLSSLKSAQSAWAKEKSTILILDQALPPEPKPDQLLRQIEALAAFRSVSLESLNIGKVNLLVKTEKQPTEKEQAFEIVLNLKGNYENTFAFLSDIEKLRRLVVVPSFSFGTSKKESEQDLLILTINGTVPYHEVGVASGGSPAERQKR